MNKLARLLLGLLAAVTMGGTLGACGNDDGDDATATTAGEGGGDLAAACQGDLDLNAALGGFFGSLEEPPEGEAPSEEFISGLQGTFDEQIEPTLSRVEENAPEEIQADITVAASSLRDFRNAPSPDNEPSDEQQAAIDRVDTYFFENCDAGTKAEITAVNYAFNGAPADAAAGSVRFKFQNDGTEVHEGILLAKADGVTESFEELLQLPEEEGRSKSRPVGQAFFAPGETGYLGAEVVAGEYLLACFIPVGTDP